MKRGELTGERGFRRVLQGQRGGRGGGERGAGDGDAAGDLSGASVGSDRRGGGSGEGGVLAELSEGRRAGDGVVPELVEKTH